MSPPESGVGSRQTPRPRPTGAPNTGANGDSERAIEGLDVGLLRSSNMGWFLPRPRPGQLPRRSYAGGKQPVQGQVAAAAVPQQQHSHRAQLQQAQAAQGAQQQAQLNDTVSPHIPEHVRSHIERKPYLLVLDRAEPTLSPGVSSGLEVPRIAHLESAPGARVVFGNAAMKAAARSLQPVKGALSFSRMISASSTMLKISGILFV